MAGWVKLHRKTVKWGWYKKAHMFHLFSHLIMSANREDGWWEGKKVLRGQLVTGRKSLSLATGISQQTIRTCLTRLAKTGEINQETNQAYTIITINNYDEYQSCDEKPTKESTNDQPTINQRSTTNKKLRNKEVEKKEYGEFSNVRLSDDEFSKLKERFNGTLSTRIERLSSYIASKGARYKSHYATILAWAQKDDEKAGTARSKKDEANDLREKWARELLDAEAGGGDEGVGDQIQRQATDASRDDLPCKRVLP